MQISLHDTVLFISVVSDSVLLCIVWNTLQSLLHKSLPPSGIFSSLERNTCPSRHCIVLDSFVKIVQRVNEVGGWFSNFFWSEATIDEDFFFAVKYYFKWLWGFANSKYMNRRMLIYWHLVEIDNVVIKSGLDGFVTINKWIFIGDSAARHSMSVGTFLHSACIIFYRSSFAKALWHALDW